MIAVATPAPDFTLRSHADRMVRLSDFRGKQNVVLAFHVLAFTPVCAVQMQAYEKDQSAVRDALRELDDFLSKFPDSKYVKSAREFRTEVMRRLVEAARVAIQKLRSTI